MEEIKLENHVLLIDSDATYQYHDIYNEKCSCSNCRNFFLGFYQNYSKVVEFLRMLSIDVQYPIEIIEYGYGWDKKIQYSVYYSVKGKLPDEKVELEYDDVLIKCSSRNDAVYSNTGMSDPCFIVEIEELYLPWLLDEPYAE